MSIGKRFFVFLFVECFIAVAMFVAIMTATLRESPALVQKTDAMRAEIVAHFTALGYEEDYYKWIRTDPLGNVDSRMGLSFNVHGNLESISCEAGYINTQSADAIYSDMEATVRAMGDSLDSQKNDIYISAFFIPKTIALTLHLQQGCNGGAAGGQRSVVAWCNVQYRIKRIIQVPAQH